MQLRFNFRRRMRGWMKHAGSAVVCTWMGVMMLSVMGFAKTPRTIDSQIPVSHIRTKMSLIHVGSNDSFNPTSDGTQAARLLLDALENKQLDKARKAIEIYDAIIPRENYGGEYTALQWFAQYLVSSKSEKPTFLSDPFVAEFFNFFANNDFSTLKEYLKRKYNLEKVGDNDTRTGQERRALLEDTILFNNPRREQWERTSKILKALKLKKGAVIADIGSGPSTLVGADGMDRLRIMRDFGVDRQTIGIQSLDDFVFQNFNLLPRTSALENVAMPLFYSAEQIPMRKAHERAGQALKRVGLADRMGHGSAQLSGGQQQRVAIARALVNGPKMLLADEPTGNLDSRTGVEILEMFRHLNNTDRITMLLITHDFNVAAYADRVILIRDGRIVDHCCGPRDFPAMHSFLNND